MLGFLLERLRRARCPDGIILATTTLREDETVAQVGLAAGVSVVCGPAKDVLGRFAQAADAAESEVIVRICADNPLTDPKIIDLAVSALVEGNVDHVSCFERHTYPYGVGCSVFTRAALDRAVAQARNDHDREHVEPAMLRDDVVRTLYLEAPSHLRRPDIRVTVDFAADLDRVRQIAERLLDIAGGTFDTADLIAAIDGAAENGTPRRARRQE